MNFDTVSHSAWTVRLGGFLAAAMLIANADQIG
jgi:hypothetical protein